MINPKKSLGQNFLFDKNVIEKILLNAKIKNNNVLEIGPGTGNLTSKILHKDPASIILIEKDKSLYANLKKNLSNPNNKIRFFNKDILDFDLENEIKEKTLIFGNLPYNIASQILVKLIKFNKWPPKFNFLALMFQKEVGDKIISRHGNKNYGRLSVLTNFRLKIIDHFNISKNCFFPKPKVESKVIFFKPKINKKHYIRDIDNLEKITHIFFSSKRKMINKAFKSIFKDHEKISKILKIDQSKRPAQLTEDEYYAITVLYEQNLN
jgi:16S rRNA (adenine1518-N6/adenine1519-N6)-dimethyltransferase